MNLVRDVKNIPSFVNLYFPWDVNFPGHKDTYNCYHNINRARQVQTVYLTPPPWFECQFHGPFHSYQNLNDHDASPTCHFMATLHNGVTHFDLSHFHVMSPTHWTFSPVGGHMQWLCHVTGLTIWLEVLWQNVPHYIASSKTNEG